MVGVLRGKMTPVLRPGVLASGQALWTPAVDSALRFSQLKKAKDKMQKQAASCCKARQVLMRARKFLECDHDC